jgi:hypothetical protein
MDSDSNGTLVNGRNVPSCSHKQNALSADSCPDWNVGGKFSLFLSYPQDANFILGWFHSRPCALVILFLHI